MAVDLVVVTAIAGAIPASIPLSVRNKNSNIAIPLLALRLRFFASRSSRFSGFVAERSPGQFRFYNQRQLESET